MSDKSVDPDQMLHFVASDLGLHCSGWSDQIIRLIQYMDHNTIRSLIASAFSSPIYVNILFSLIRLKWYSDTPCVP